MTPDPLLCNTGSRCDSCHHFDEVRGTCALLELLGDITAPERATSPPLTFGVAEPWRTPYRATEADTVPLSAWSEA